MHKDAYYSDKNPNSNFDGDWDEQCAYCGLPHREHIHENPLIPDYKHRTPCHEHQQAMIADQQRSVLLGKTLIFIGWILVPLAIAIIGFASPVFGAILFLVSLFKIGIEGIKLFGNPNKLIPGYTEKSEKKHKMEHYFHHCEQNPEAFERLKVENFKRDLKEPHPPTRETAKIRPSTQTPRGVKMGRGLGQSPIS